MEDIQLIDLGSPVFKNCGARWLVKAAEHFLKNPQIIVKDFIKTSNTTALYGIRESITDGSDDDNASSSYESLDTDDCDFVYVASADDSTD